MLLKSLPQKGFLTSEGFGESENEAGRPGREEKEKGEAGPNEAFRRPSLVFARPGASLGMYEGDGCKSHAKLVSYGHPPADGKIDEEQDEGAHAGGLRTEEGS